MLPLLCSYLNSLPKEAVLRIVGEAMLSELIRELTVRKFAFLEADAAMPF